MRAGSEYKVTTERPTVNINVKELDAGSWVMFELPGFTTASTGTAQSSLDALRKASDTSYYKGNGSLWVKIVSTGDILGSGPGKGPGPGDSLAGQPVSSNPVARARAPGCARGSFFCYFATAGAAPSTVTGAVSVNVKRVPDGRFICEPLTTAMRVISTC